MLVALDVLVYQTSQSSNTAHADP